MRKSLIAISIIASLTTLAGCGSSSSSDSVSEDTADTTTLAGTAAKGIIQQGIVTATELAADATALSVVGTTITDDSGHYTLELTDAYQGGVVKLTISAGENTTMKCDATVGCGTGKAFGSSVDLEEGFSLNAIVKPTTENVNVQITPLTHMATARALASSEGLNAESVSNAISEVSQMAGVDIMSTEIVDITDASALEGASEEAKQLAVFNSGLADLLVAGEGTLQEKLIANLDELASSFEDGEFSSEDDITIGAITEAISSAATAISENDDINEALSDSIAEVEEDIELIELLIGEDGSYNPEPSTGAGSDPITQAKALLTQARTFIEKVESDFTDPLDALSIDAEAVAEVFDADSIVMTELLGIALEQTITDLDERDIDIFAELESETPSIYNTKIYDDADELIGTITSTLSSDELGVSITLSGSLTGEAETVDITDLKLATNLTSESLTTSTEGDETLLDAMTAATAQIKLTGFIGNETTSLTLTNVALAVSASESITLDMTDEGDNDALESKLTGASFIGDMTVASHGASFNGYVEVVLVGFANSAADVPLSLQKIEVNGEFNSAEKGSFSAGAKLVVDNATSFDTFGYLDQDSTAYMYTNFGYSLSDSDLATVNDAVGYTLTDESQFDIYYQSYNDTYNVWFTVDGFEWHNDQYAIDLPDLEQSMLINATEMDYSVVPDDTTIQWLDYHNISDDGTNAYGEVKVELPDFESSDNFVKGTLTVMAKANIPELPEATVIASVSRTELTGGDASITVSYSGQTFKLSVDSEDLDAEEPKATVRITNFDGVIVTAHLAETLSGDAYLVSGSVLVDGVQVGTIEETGSGIVLVRYTDGTFESLY